KKERHDRAAERRPNRPSQQLVVDQLTPGNRCGKEKLDLRPCEGECWPPRPRDDPRERRDHENEQPGAELHGLATTRDRRERPDVVRSSSPASKHGHVKVRRADDRADGVARPAQALEAHTIEIPARSKPEKEKRAGHRESRAVAL